MSFIVWWAIKYSNFRGEDVPEKFYSAMQDAYEQGKVDERNAIIKYAKEHYGSLSVVEIIAMSKLRDIENASNR